jgi:hypothetical protein
MRMSPGLSQPVPACPVVSPTVSKCPPTEQNQRVKTLKPYVGTNAARAAKPWESEQ